MQVRGQVSVCTRRPRAPQPRPTPQVQDRVVPHIPHSGLLSLRPTLPLHPQRRGGPRHAAATQEPTPSSVPPSGPWLQRGNSITSQQSRQRVPTAVFLLRFLLHTSGYSGESELTVSLPEPPSATNLARQTSRLQQHEQTRYGAGLPVRQ